MLLIYKRKKALAVSLLRMNLTCIRGGTLAKLMLFNCSDVRARAVRYRQNIGRTGGFQGIVTTLQSGAGGGVGWLRVPWEQSLWQLQASCSVLLLMRRGTIVHKNSAGCMSSCQSCSLQCIMPVRVLQQPHSGPLVLWIYAGLMHMHRC